MGRPSIPAGGAGEPTTKEIRRGEWAARVRWRDASGGYHEARGRGRTKGEAVDSVMERVDLAQLEYDDAVTRAEDMTLDEASELWLADVAADGLVRASTVRQYRATWEGTLSPAFGSDLLNEVTRADLQRGLRALRRRDRHGNHILDERGQTIPLTGRQPRAVLMMLLGYAADEGIRTDGTNPIAGTRRKKGRKKKGTEHGPRVLTGAEWGRLYALAVATTLRHHNSTTHLPDVLVLLRWTGVRIGEALALMWEDIDLSGEVPTATVERTLTDVGPGLNHGDTKGTETRVFALHNDVVEMLESRKFNATGSPWVFANGRSDRPVTANNLRRRLRAAIKGTDLDFVHPHTLRHTLATAASKAHDDEAAAELLGNGVDVARAHYIRKDDKIVLDPRGVFGSDETPESAPDAP